MPDKVENCSFDLLNVHVNEANISGNEWNENLNEGNSLFWEGVLAL